LFETLVQGSEFDGFIWRYHSYDEGFIKLSTPLWFKASEEEKRTVVIHEACHVIANYIYNGNQKHNKNWKSCMVKCGLKPIRCHNIDTTELRKKRKGSVEFTCACPGKTYVLGSVRVKKWKNGKRYFCTLCKKTLNTQSEVT